MVPAPQCAMRHCKHLVGRKPPPKGEEDGRFFCRAFPDGIPNEIIYGQNKHTKPYPGDHGIQYELDAEAKAAFEAED